MSSASDQKLFCEICSAFNCSFDEFVGEKVVSPSYSSAILDPPDLFIFISNFIDLILLPFFLDEAGEQFVYFIYLLKEPEFSFLDSCHSLPHIFFICFFSDCYDFFILLILGFLFSSFSSCFRCKVRLFI